MLLFLCHCCQKRTPHMSPLYYPNILPQSSHTNFDTFLVTGCLTTFSFLLTRVKGLSGFRFAEYVVFTFPWLITSCSTKAWNRLLPQLGQQSKCFGFLSFVNSESSTTTPTIIASNVNMAAIINTSLHNIFAFRRPQHIAFGSSLGSRSIRIPAMIL